MKSLRSRKCLQALLAALAVSLVLFGAFFPPVVRHFAGGIPFTAVSEQAPRELVQGDHLQLLYHFDLAHSFMTGGTPWFRNLYEFNTSDEACPRRVDLFYAPFSLPYSGLRMCGASKAFAWNFCQLLSVFLGVLFTMLLSRRFGAGFRTSLVIALLVNCVPYRWIVLAGGSPTGFGMGIIPGIALGVDIAVRDGRIRGGVLGALLCCAAYAADLHCFLFSILALPLWGVLSILCASSNPLASRKSISRTALAVSPFLPAALFCAVFAKIAKSGYASTDVAGGRTLKEIQRCSPDWHSFFDPNFFCHCPGQFHVGYGLSVLMLAAGILLLAALLMRLRRGADGSTLRLGRIGAGLLLGAAIVFLFLLALGTNGPLEYAPLRLVRKLVPPFRLVRQPLKCLCLLPTLLAMFFALSTATLPAAVERFRGGWQRAGIAVAGIVVLATFVHLTSTFQTGICLLTGPNAAYEAAVRDAEARGLQPRALVLPIWPGDSSYSSVYQYDAMLSRLRLLNGYSATKSPDYIDKVFLRLSPITEGIVGTEQFEGLDEYGVTTVILHENEWPAKVSPYPFGHTLHTILLNPKFRFLGNDHGVWSFAYDPSSTSTQPDAPAHPIYRSKAITRFQAVKALAVVPASEDGTVTIPAAYLAHELGETRLGPNGLPAGLAFRPRKDTACLGCHGPFVPLGIPPGTYRLSATFDGIPAQDDRIRLILGEDVPITTGLAEDISFHYDGSKPVAVEFHYGGSSVLLLQEFRIVPEPSSSTNNP